MWTVFVLFSIGTHTVRTSRLLNDVQSPRDIMHAPRILYPFIAAIIMHARRVPLPRVTVTSRSQRRARLTSCVFIGGLYGSLTRLRLGCWFDYLEDFCQRVRDTTGECLLPPRWMTPGYWLWFHRGRRAGGFLTVFRARTCVAAQHRRNMGTGMKRGWRPQP